MKLASEANVFMACDKSLEEARTVVYGAPYDGTSSLRPGSRFAPQAMRSLSDGIESYSPYQNKDLEDLAIHDGGDLVLPFGDKEKVLALVEDQSQKILDLDKQPVMLGGEHLLTLACVKAVYAKYPDLHVIHLDAHTDLRDDYLGEELSHATVIKQVWKILGDDRIHSFGIRSGLKEEFEFGRKHLDHKPFSLAGIKKSIQEYELKEKQIPIYLTIDLDVLDPSIFPGTGTPEPGGASFQELLGAIIDMSGLNVVGFDLVELSPDYDHSGVSTLVACKVLRECLIAFS